MNIIKEILKNYLIKIPFVEKLSTARGLTGVNNNEEEVNEILNKYKSFVDLKGKNILEVGPGHTFDVLLKAKNQEGAKSISGVDIIDYVPQKDPSINFKLYDGSRIPFDNSSFDITWSWTVYEHVRHPETTIKETNRVLKEGGYSINYIDLVDHFAYTAYHVVDDTLVFNCLKYSKKLWNLMTWNRGMYVNRVRLSEWIHMYEKNGFEIIHKEITKNEYVNKNYKSIAYLKNLNEIDASTMQVLLVCKKK